MFRLGKELCIRLPRRKLASDLILHEQTILPQIASRLPLPVPSPVRTGAPDEDYPWAWSILPWMRGTSADLSPVNPAQAVILGEFLRVLHSLPSEGLPHNPYRGVPLMERDAVIRTRMAALSPFWPGLIQAVGKIWDRSCASPVSRESVLLHGDLHPQNILTDDGRITGIIDWGDITRGDAATDLAVAWMLFPDESDREVFFDACGATDEDLIQRARGWAAVFGTMLLEAGRVNNPRQARLGMRTLSNLTGMPEESI